MLSKNWTVGGDQNSGCHGSFPRIVICPPSHQNTYGKFCRMHGKHTLCRGGSIDGAVLRVTGILPVSRFITEGCSKNCCKAAFTVLVSSIDSNLLHCACNSECGNPSI